MTIKEIELKRVFGYGDEFSTVIDFMRHGRIDTAHMLSDEIPLERIEVDGFQRIIREEDLVKVVVKPDAAPINL